MEDIEEEQRILADLGLESNEFHGRIGKGGRKRLNEQINERAPV